MRQLTVVDGKYQVMNPAFVDWMSYQQRYNSTDSVFHPGKAKFKVRTLEEI